MKRARMKCVLAIGLIVCLAVQPAAMVSAAEMEPAAEAGSIEEPETVEEEEPAEEPEIVEEEEPTEEPEAMEEEEPAEEPEAVEEEEPTEEPEAVEEEEPTEEPEAVEEEEPTEKPEAVEEEEATEDSADERTPQIKDIVKFSEEGIRLGEFFEVEEGTAYTYFTPEESGNYLITLSMNVDYTAWKVFDGFMEDLAVSGVLPSDGCSRKIYYMEADTEYCLEDYVDGSFSVCIEKAPEDLGAVTLEAGSSATVNAGDYGLFAIVNESWPEEFYLKLPEGVSAEDVEVWYGNEGIDSIYKGSFTVLPLTDGNYVSFSGDYESYIICVNGGYDSEKTYEFLDGLDYAESVTAMPDTVSVPANGGKYYMVSSDRARVYAMYVPEGITVKGASEQYDFNRGSLYLWRIAKYASDIDFVNETDTAKDIRIYDIYETDWTSLDNGQSVTAAQGGISIYEWMPGRGFLTAQTLAAESESVSAIILSYSTDGEDPYAVDIEWGSASSYITESNKNWYYVEQDNTLSYADDILKTYVIIDTSSASVSVETKGEISTVKTITDWCGTDTLGASGENLFRYLPDNGEEQKGKVIVVKDNGMLNGIYGLSSAGNNIMADATAYNGKPCYKLDINAGDYFYIDCGDESVEIEWTCLSELLADAPELTLGTRITLDADTGRWAYKFTAPEDGFYTYEREYDYETCYFYDRNGEEITTADCFHHMKKGDTCLLIFNSGWEGMETAVVKCDTVQAKLGKNTFEEGWNIFTFTPDKSGTYVFDRYMTILDLENNRELSWQMEDGELRYNMEEHTPYAFCTYGEFYEEEWEFLFARRETVEIYDYDYYEAYMASGAALGTGTGTGVLYAGCSYGSLQEAIISGSIYAPGVNVEGIYTINETPDTNGRYPMGDVMDETAVYSGGSLVVKGYPKTVYAERIELKDTDLMLKVGDNAELTYLLDSGNKFPVNVTGVTFTSSDEDVVTVADGIVTAVSEGTAVVTVTVDEQNPNHEGIIEACCRVTVTNALIDIADADITDIPNQLYTAKQISPKVAVSYNGTALAEGMDYTVSFEKNKDIGTASVTITGMGAYTGTVQKTFNIYVKKGGSYVIGKQQYTILNANTDGSGTVRVDCAVDKTITAAKIGPTIKIGGKVFRITEIKANAFKDCTQLKGATIGNYVTSIGANAFYGCTKLVYAIGAANVTDIGSKAFYNCTSLIKYGNSNNRITAARTIAIGADAFRNCTSVTYVNLSSAALTTIGERAFYGCKSVGTLVMSGKAIRTIGKNAFTNCSSLSVVTIKSERIASIGAQAFKGIKSTCSFKVPAVKLTEYTNLIRKAGVPGTVKVRK